jgi:hypothetical protein
VNLSALIDTYIELIKWVYLTYNICDNSFPLFRKNQNFINTNDIDFTS